MNVPLLLLALVASIAVRAQAIPTTGATPASFIPKGYQQLPEGRATGDLNDDGRPDVVLALTSQLEIAMRPGHQLPPRLLLVLWRTATGGYQRATIARHLLLHYNSGINGADPFLGLAIRRGVLLVNYGVGGNCGHSTNATFRFQQGNFYLIGERNCSGFLYPACPRLPYQRAYYYRDVNYSTGSYKVVRTSPQCRLLENKRGRQPVRPLRKLTEYKPEA